MDTDRRELIGRMYYVLTVEAEKSAGAAVDGQASALSSKDAQRLARQLHDSAQTIMVMADAIVELAVHQDSV